MRRVIHGLVLNEGSDVSGRGISKPVSPGGSFGGFAVSQRELAFELDTPRISDVRFPPDVDHDWGMRPGERQNPVRQAGDDDEESREAPQRTPPAHKVNPRRFGQHGHLGNTIKKPRRASSGLRDRSRGRAIRYRHRSARARPPGSHRRGPADRVHPRESPPSAQIAHHVRVDDRIDIAQPLEATWSRDQEEHEFALHLLHNPMLERRR